MSQGLQMTEGLRKKNVFLFHTIQCVFAPHTFLGPTFKFATISVLISRITLSLKVLQMRWVTHQRSQIDTHSFQGHSRQSSLTTALKWSLLFIIISGINKMFLCPVRMLLKETALCFYLKRLFILLHVPCMYCNCKVTHTGPGWTGCWIDNATVSVLQRFLRVPLLCTADESGSDEDFMVEDDDDSDYGHSKKRGKKVIRRGRPDKKEKKSPKPRLKATGERSSPSAAVNLCKCVCDAAGCPVRSGAQ